MQRQVGFSLIELVAVLAVISILMAIAIPQYQQYQQRAQRAQAQGDLLEAAQRLERYRMVQGSYNSATAGTATTNTIPNQSPTTGTARYNIGFWSGSAVATTIPSSSTYTLYAVRSDNSEVFALNALGQKCYGPSVATFNFATCQRWEDAP